MLIICWTPLQALIIEAMLKKLKCKNSRIIYGSWIDNSKHRFYYQRIERQALISIFVHLNSKFLCNFHKFLLALNRINASLASTIALGSIDNIYCQYVVKKYQFNNILTFDDGTANINISSAYYTLPKISFQRKITQKIIRGNIDHFWLRNKSKLHFTIFSGYKNIVPEHRLVNLSLFSIPEYSLNTCKKHYRIFLGQPLNEYFNNSLINILKRIEREVTIDEYIMHPREIQPLFKSKISRTLLIAEEYIIQKLNIFSYINLISFGSTVQINITHSRLRKIVLTFNGINQVLLDMQPLFRSVGCDIMNIEEFFEKFQ